MDFHSFLSHSRVLSSWIRRIHRNIASTIDSRSYFMLYGGPTTLTSQPDQLTFNVLVTGKLFENWKRIQNRMPSIQMNTLYW